MFSGSIVGRIISALILTVVFLAVRPSRALGQSEQVNDTAYVESNGAKLFIEMRGPSKSAPMLLYLHGGPGSALGIISFRAYVGPQLEQKCLVVYLHERGVVGSPAVPAATQTIANHVADVQNVVKYLRERFPGRRLYLLGHSWGGTLAVLSTVGHPHLADGVIDVAGPFNLPAALKASYQETLEWEKKQNNTEAIKELTDLGPPPYKDINGQIAFSKWTSSAMGGIDKNFSAEKFLSRAPYTKMEQSWEDTELSIVGAMYPELGHLNLVPDLPKLKAPLLVILGVRDTIVPTAQLKGDYRLYGGPKQWVEMNDSHHLPFVDEPELFVKAVEDFVR